MRQILLHKFPPNLGPGWYYKDNSIFYSTTIVPAFYIPFDDISKELFTKTDVFAKINVINHFKKSVFENIPYTYMTAFWHINLNDNTATIYLKVENQNINTFFNQILKKS